MSKLLPVGTGVYYTGDMANHPGKGEVIAHRVIFGMPATCKKGWLCR